MSNEAQINANRQNAQKSTGPRSAEGKAAVAKNAVKHGVFASQTLIKGENQEDFDLFRDEMLAECAPVGATESMLAERFVSLSWRLQRIERFQDQAIDAMIDKQLNSPLAKMTEMMLPKNLRRQESDGPEPDLTLGKVAMRDFAGARILERLLMYERRIENSMLKTMDELRRCRIMRQLENAREELSTDMDHPNPDKRHRDNTATWLSQDKATKGFKRDELFGPVHRPGLTVVGAATVKQKYAKQSQFRLAHRPVLGGGHGHNGHG